MKGPKVWLLPDSHLNHDNIRSYCKRPSNWTDLLIGNWKQRVRPEDILIHFGDVGIGNQEGTNEIIKSLPGRKILIRGNHDRDHSLMYWMTKGGFDFACDSMIYNRCYLTHEPAERLIPHTYLNIHGHLHNIFHGFHKNASVSAADEKYMKTHLKLANPWQRLAALEYMDYKPVEMEEFLSHPDKYLARGVINDTARTTYERLAKAISEGDSNEPVRPKVVSPRPGDDADLLI